MVNTVKNEIPNISDLVRDTDYDAKTSDIGCKYSTASEYNKFTYNILNPEIKNKELVNKSDLSKFANNIDLDEKIKTLVTKAELKAEQDKIKKMKTYLTQVLLSIKVIFSMMDHKIS